MSGGHLRKIDIDIMEELERIKGLKDKGANQ